MVRRNIQAVELERAAAGQLSDFDGQQRVRRRVAGIAEPKVCHRERVGSVFERGDGLVRTSRRVVHRCHVEGDGVRARVQVHTAVGRAAVVLHRKLEVRVAGPVGVERRREHQLVQRNVARRHQLVRRNIQAVELERAAAGQLSDFDGQQRVRRRVAGIAEPKVCHRERVGSVFERGDGLVRTSRRVVHRCHVEGDGVRARVQVHAGVGRAAVVLHRKLEVRVARPVGVGHRGEHQLIQRNVARRYRLVCSDVHAVELERAAAWQLGDFDGQQRVRRRVADIAKPKVGHRERVGSVFERSDGLVRARRRVVHRRDIKGDGVRARVQVRTAVGRAAVVLDRKPEVRIARTVGVEGRRENQPIGCDVGHRH